MRKGFLSKWVVLCCCAVSLASCNQTDRQNQPQQPAIKLTFAYLTDVHLNKDNSGNGNEGLKKALKVAADQGAEFVLLAETMQTPTSWAMPK